MSKPRDPTAFERAENIRMLWNFLVPLAGVIVGTALIAVALATHDQILAVLGVGALLQPGVEWAVQRRVDGIVHRLYMQGESFDGVWREMNSTLAKLAVRIEKLEEARFPVLPQKRG